MIELEVSNKVLLALKNSFPKPEKSAERALSKYVAALTEQLNQSQQYADNCSVHRCQSRQAQISC